VEARDKKERDGEGGDGEDGNEQSRHAGSLSGTDGRA
jgi:hypothetical protein